MFLKKQLVPGEKIINFLIIFLLGYLIFGCNGFATENDLKDSLLGTKARNPDDLSEVLSVPYYEPENEEEDGERKDQELSTILCKRSKDRVYLDDQEFLLIPIDAAQKKQEEERDQFISSTLSKVESEIFKEEPIPCSKKISRVMCGGLGFIPPMLLSGLFMASTADFLGISAPGSAYSDAMITWIVTTLSPATVNGFIEIGDSLYDFIRGSRCCRRKQSTEVVTRDIFYKNTSMYKVVQASTLVGSVVTSLPIIAHARKIEEGFPTFEYITIPFTTAWLSYEMFNLSNKTTQSLFNRKTYPKNLYTVPRKKVLLHILRQKEERIKKIGSEDLESDYEGFFEKQEVSKSTSSNRDVSVILENIDTTVLQTQEEMQGKLFNLFSLASETSHSMRSVSVGLENDTEEDNRGINAKAFGQSFGRELSKGATNAVMTLGAVGRYYIMKTIIPDLEDSFNNRQVGTYLGESLCIMGPLLKAYAESEVHHDTTRKLMALPASLKSFSPQMEHVSTLVAFTNACLFATMFYVIGSHNEELSDFQKVLFLGSSALLDVSYFSDSFSSAYNNMITNIRRKLCCSKPIRMKERLSSFYKHAKSVIWQLNDSTTGIVYSFVRTE